MLKRPSKEVLTALASLESNSQFERVVSWLEDSLQDMYATTAVTKDEVLSRWHQGASQAVMELLEHLRDARTSLDRSR